MDSDQARRSQQAGAREAGGPRAELDRLVEGELTALLAEQVASTPPPQPPRDDPAERFIEDAAAFLAGRADRDLLLARLQAASAMPAPTPPAESGSDEPDPE